MTLPTRRWRTRRIVRILAAISLAAPVSPVRAQVSGDNAFPGNPAEYALFRAWYICEYNRTIAVDASRTYDVNGLHPAPSNMADLIAADCIEEAGALNTRMYNACFDANFTMPDVKSCAANVNMEEREALIRIILTARGKRP